MKKETPPPPMLKQLLTMRANWYQDALMARAKDTPYRDITPAQARVLQTMRGQAMSIAELARQLAVSRQATHRLVQDLIEQGLLEAEVNPDDGRERVVRYTRQGMTELKMAVEIIQDIERRLERRIGAANVEQLRRILLMDWGSHEDA